MILASGIITVFYQVVKKAPRYGGQIRKLCSSSLQPQGAGGLDLSPVFWGLGGLCRIN